MGRAAKLQRRYWGRTVVRSVFRHPARYVNGAGTTNSWALRFNQIALFRPEAGVKAVEGCVGASRQECEIYRGIRGFSGAEQRGHQERLGRAISREGYLRGKRLVCALCGSGVADGE